MRLDEKLGSDSTPRSADISRQMKGGRELDWARDRSGWPNHGASRFVEAAGLSWHVQIAGEGPPLLLLHGTGSSTHSWRDLLPRLSARFTVIAPDLPGHAFTTTPPASGMSLPGMASAVNALLGVLGLSPRLAVGHSAGAAVLAQMCLEGAIVPAGLISLNGAMLPIGGLAGQLFSPLAKALASGPTIPRVLSWFAGDRAVVDRLIHQTGSTLDASGLTFYRRLAHDPQHMAGALAMMANWDLEKLWRRLPDLSVPLVLVAGSRDGSIPPNDAFRVRSLVRGSRVEMLKGLGHLAHEERPAQVADLIEACARTWAVLPPEPDHRNRPSP